ncbi:hypothetical protein GGS24DRAFT_514333 [Hypoxylon argillaceum]|nr:hypothetical protein GGS24DRAFT_514333 [Hypoxylon argillaceum]
MATPPNSPSLLNQETESSHLSEAEDISDYSIITDYDGEPLPLYNGEKLPAYSFPPQPRPHPRVPSSGSRFIECFDLNPTEQENASIEPPQYVEVPLVVSAEVAEPGGESKPSRLFLQLRSYFIAKLKSLKYKFLGE